MSPARARRVVALSGIATAMVVALALWVFGGPAASRLEGRDQLSLSHLQTIIDALDCQERLNPVGAPPSALDQLSEACLAASRIAELVDPLTGAPYSIAHPEPRIVRVCAAFERPKALLWTPPAFGPASGCLSASFPDPPPDAG